MSNDGELFRRFVEAHMLYQHPAQQRALQHSVQRVVAANNPRRQVKK